MGTIERLTLNALAGDDKLVTDAGVTLPITVGRGRRARTPSPPATAPTSSRAARASTRSTAAPAATASSATRGNDVMNGNAGDDTLVWNNGDGTDAMNGDDGLDRIEDNLGAADDNVADQGRRRQGRATTASTRPFALNIDSAEVLELNTFGGNDTFERRAWRRRADRRDRRRRRGQRRASPAATSPTRSSAAPATTRSTGGAGLGDVLDGQDGDDILSVPRRRGATSPAAASATTARLADAVDVLVDGRERRRPPTPPAPERRRTADRTSARRNACTSKLKRGVYRPARVESCPAAEAGGCKGTLALQTAKADQASAASRSPSLVGSKQLHAGRRAAPDVTVHAAQGHAQVSQKAARSLRAVSTSDDAAGNVATGTSRLAVKLVK